MANLIDVAGALLLGFGSSMVLVGAPAGGPTTPERKPAELVSLVPVEREKVPLEGSSVLIALPGSKGTHEVRVFLRSTEYEGTFIYEELQGRPKEGAVWCYELESDDPYTWAIWSAHPLGAFRLVSSGENQNYLAWANGTRLRIAEVSQSRDRCIALRDYLAAQPLAGLLSIPVADLVPIHEPWGLSDFYLDIRLLSLVQREDGTFLVKISNPEGTEAYTLVGHGYQWRLAEPEAKDKPEAAKPEAVTPQAAQPQHKAQAPKEPGQ